jgi:cell division protein FtsB
MPSIAEQIADLDRRIAYLEKSAEDLRQQLALLNKNTIQYVRFNDLLVMGERTIANMRAQRETLAKQDDAGK